MKASVLHETFNPAATYGGLFHAGPKAEMALLTHMGMIVPKQYRHRVERETIGPIPGPPSGGLFWTYIGGVMQ